MGTRAGPLLEPLRDPHLVLQNDPKKVTAKLETDSPSPFFVLKNGVEKSGRFLNRFFALPRLLLDKVFMARASST